MKKQQDQQPIADAMTLSEFMNSLQRIFKIAIYYPTGHHILDKATERFMSQLTDIAGEKHAVTLQVFNDGILVQGAEVSAEIPFVKEFNEMLRSLSVHGVTFDRQISLEEIHDFIRKIIAFRAKVINTKQFTQIDLTGLPHSVRLEQAEFLARKDSSVSREGDDEAADDLESFIDSLSKQGLDQSEINQCRTLLDSLSERLTNSSLEVGDLPYASWDDVGSLLARTIRGGGIKNAELNEPPQSNINALASILKNLEKETSDQNSKDAINLLVRIIKKPKQQISESDPAKISRRTYPKNPQVSLKKIQEFSAKKRLQDKILKKIPEAPTGNEVLSILMQMVGYDQSLPVQIRMQQLYREHLAEELSDKTWDIITYGLYGVIEGGSQKRVSATIKLLLEPLRRSVHSSSLTLFHKTIQLCSLEQKQKLWPYIVNELLVVGSGSEKLHYHELCQLAAQVTHEQMVAYLPQLKTLDAFQETKIASDIFLAVSPPCYPLFAFLFKTELERYIGERVIGGLKRNPPEWLIKAVAPILDLTLQDHKMFLYSYLRQAPSKVISDPLKTIAAKIITETLPTLSQERRNERWLETTIHSMAQLPGEKTLELLKQIAGAKKMIFIHEWPSSCREAAAKALSQRKR